MIIFQWRQSDFSLFCRRIIKSFFLAAHLQFRYSFELLGSITATYIFRGPLTTVSRKCSLILNSLCHFKCFLYLFLRFAQWSLLHTDSFNFLNFKAFGLCQFIFYEAWIFYFHKLETCFEIVVNLQYSNHFI